MGKYNLFGTIRISAKTCINFLCYIAIGFVFAGCAALEPDRNEVYQRKDDYLAGIHGSQKSNTDKAYGTPHDEHLKTVGTAVPATRKNPKGFFDKLFGPNNNGFLRMRQKSYNEHYRAFDELAYTPEIDETYTITVTIRVVGDHSKYPYAPFAKQKRYGYYDSATNTIWVLGKKLNGQIIQNEFALGHEMTHTLNLKYSTVADPDRYDQLAEMDEMDVIAASFVNKKE
jgi:hypothetical protein